MNLQTNVEVTNIIRQTIVEVVAIPIQLTNVEVAGQTKYNQRYSPDKRQTVLLEVDNTVR